VASVVVSLLTSLRLVVQSRASLHLEIIALRHQLAVLDPIAALASSFDLGRQDAVGGAVAAMVRLARGAMSCSQRLCSPSGAAFAFWTRKSRQRTSSPLMTPEVRSRHGARRDETPT
jgi:hypothetical protein